MQSQTRIDKIIFKTNEVGRYIFPDFKIYYSLSNQENVAMVRVIKHKSMECNRNHNFW